MNILNITRAGRQKKIKLERKDFRPRNCLCLLRGFCGNDELLAGEFATAQRDLDVFVADGFNDVLFVGGTDGILHDNIKHKQN